MAPFCRGRFHQNNKRFKSKLKNVKKHRKGMKNLQAKLDKLKAVMEEIRVEQQNITGRQREVMEKFVVIESRCEEWKRESRIIIQQALRTQFKLAVMYKIMKASQQADHAATANLTRYLREIVRRENMESQASGDK